MSSNFESLLSSLCNRTSSAQNGVDCYRYYSSDPDIWPDVDPMSDKYPSLSPYTCCADNPVNRIDPDGVLDDWCQNDKTGNYTWFEGSEEKAGFTHIGGKGSVFGEFEAYINDNLKNVYGVGGMYGEGFTFDIVDNNKGALLPVDGKGGGNFLDEFANGTGQEFSVYHPDHPYTKAMKEQPSVKLSNNLINKGLTEVKGQRTAVGSGFGWRGYIGSFSMAEQFIGSYRLDVFSSQKGN